MSHRISLNMFTGILAFAAIPCFAEDAAAIQTRLVAEYALTQPTADNTDIVTAGAVLLLQKSDLILGPATGSGNLYQNMYRDGKISQSSFAKGKSIMHKVGKVPGLSLIPGVGAVAGVAAAADSASGAAPRTCVTGEKMWVTKIEIKAENKQEDVVFDLYTDAVQGFRYKGALKIPYPKGAGMDQIDSLVAEVFRIQPVQEARQKQNAATAQRAPRQQRAAATLPEIVPPPRPADEPVPPPLTIALGQTTDQVVATMGQPQKIVKLAKKEMYYYKDLKVIFVNGKVSDVQ